MATYEGQADRFYKSTQESEKIHDNLRGKGEGPSNRQTKEKERYKDDKRKGGFSLAILSFHVSQGGFAGHQKKKRHLRAVSPQCFFRRKRKVAYFPGGGEIENKTPKVERERGCLEGSGPNEESR